MTRRQLRYWFFRFKTELEPDGVPAEGAPEGLKEEWEDHPYFGGWDKFGVTWDLAEDSTDTIVPLRYSLEQQWNAEVAKSARPFPLPQQVSNDPEE